ncbi:MAG: BtaA family protein [Balneola sp.]
MKNLLSTLWFRYLTSRFLIYNTCWEDPKIDRFLLNLDQSSDVFMITSAGDNTFDYLLDRPRSIDCADINPQQNALLDLKCALFESGNYEHLTELFLTGKSPNYRIIYKSIRNKLNQSSQTFWDQHIHWFSHENGFYRNGLTGYFARVLNTLLKVKKLQEPVQRVINEPSLNIRKDIFTSEIEPALWQGFSKYFWKSELVLSLAGIPSTQIKSMSDLNAYMRSTLRNLFVEQGMKDNYFWKIYLEGNYTESCSPEYLKKDNFEIISSQLTKITHNTLSVTELLNSSQKKYSHFVLLDHQDWLAGNGTNELEKEWRAIFKSSKPNSKVLFRSVHKDLEFLPDFVRLKIKKTNIKTTYLKQNDRVGTYPSTFLFEIDV